MRIISVLSTKGGTGKTTLTGCLSVRAAAEEQVAVVDLDPQASWSSWWARRGCPANPRLMRNVDRASDGIRQLESRQAPESCIMLDGHPASLLSTEDAIKSATLVLVPMLPSPLDLEANQDAVQLAWEHRKPVLVVFNAVGPGDSRLVEQCRQTLAQWRVPTAKTVIANRASYKSAILTGKTGAERDPKARAEIDALWAEITEAIAAAEKSGAGV